MGGIERILEGSDSVTSVVFSPDGTRVVSGSEANSVRIWNVTTGKIERFLGGHLSWVTSVVFYPGGASVVSGSWDNTVRIWNATPGEMERVLKGHV